MTQAATVEMPAGGPPVSRAESLRTAEEQRIVLRGVDWECYEKLDELLEDVPGVRLTYLDGELEIMSPISKRHEQRKIALSSMLEAYCMDHDIDLFGQGSTTIGSKQEETSGEPDESYAFGEDKDRPDLVIEVALTSGGLNKLERYRRLAIPEVWIWSNERLGVFVLGEEGYVTADKSKVLPGIDLVTLEACARIDGTSRAVKAFQRTYR